MAFPILGAIASIGGSLLSGFGAKRAAKKADDRMLRQYNQMITRADNAEQVPLKVDQTSTVDLAAMRDEAERAGFNPASVLRAGLGSSFARTSSVTTGHNAGLSAQLIGQYLSSGQARAQEPSGMSVLGGALSTAGGLINDYSNKMMDQEFQMTLQNGYLKGVSNASRSSGSQSMFSIPSIVSAGHALEELGAGRGIGSKSASGSLFAKKAMTPWETRETGARNFGQAPSAKTVVDLPVLGKVHLSDRDDWQTVSDKLGDGEIMAALYMGGRIIESLDWNKTLMGGRPPQARDVYRAGSAALSSASSTVTTWYDNWRRRNDNLTRFPVSTGAHGGGGW